MPRYGRTRVLVTGLLAEGELELLRHDVTFPLHVEVDRTYVLACPASPFHDQHDRVQTREAPVLGAINMLGLAQAIAHFHSAMNA
jgi:UDP-glucuronate decarboxylase